MNLNQAHDVMLNTHLAALRAEMRPNAVEMRSGPGVGKSTTVTKLAVSLANSLGEAVGVVVEMLATIQSVDVRGFMLPQKASDGGFRPITVFSVPPWYPSRGNVTVFDPDGEVHAPGTWDGPIPRVGLVFLDEWGQGEDDVKKAAAELLLNGRVGNDVLPLGWRVVAASNRINDRAGVVRPLTFITNRRLELEIGAALPPWNDWVNALPDAQRPHYMTVSFANKQPDLVFRDEVPAGDKPFCTPRTLVLMDRDLQALRTPEQAERNAMPTDPVAREVCSGWIGHAEGAQYMTHLKFADLLPDIEDVIKSPSTAKLPDAMGGGQMVVAFMLVQHITSEKMVESIMKYMSRMHIDMQILMMSTVYKQVEKAKLMMHNKMYVEWIMKNKDVMTAAAI